MLLKVALLGTAIALMSYLWYRLKVRPLLKGRVVINADKTFVPPTPAREARTTPASIAFDVKADHPKLPAAVVDRGINVALKVVNDPDSVRTQVPAALPGDVRWCWTNKKLAGWNVYLLQPDMKRIGANKHSWVVHSPDGNGYALEPTLCLHRRLDEAEFNDSVRRDLMHVRADIKDASFIKAADEALKP